ncbi:5-formyltetrahydrofolate cyclo-ligase [Actimicrobium antarcticum]|uniref:5-formyltetrahydrofolate cyclo-ligase n=1 Tax=Actimicrobium antarcticum TaxID=1051899 RepID=A0ABP7T7V0_9BURK
MRKHLLATRQSMTAVHRSAACVAIGEYLLSWQASTGVDALAVYWPIRGEPDLMPAYLQLAQRGVRLALPVVCGPNAPLDFAAWLPGQAMAQDAFGVAIPAQPRHTVVPEAFLIPCVGINAQQFRLGYGGGMYDRTLALLPAATTVGIAFDSARSEFGVAPHDIGLQVLITESGVERHRPDVP